MASHFTGGDVKTPAKLKMLDWYLDRYVPIMENNWSAYWYIDTHAGTGMTECDGGILIDGSTVRVLDQYADNFDKFYFYELSEPHFHTLHETLTERFGYDFDVSETEVPGEDFLVARHEDPYIRIMQMDFNEGVTFLANVADGNPHWFTFIDPKGLTVRRETLDNLIQRGHMDILINYQTTGVMRNAAEEATHGHDSVTWTIGDSDWPVDGSADDFVNEFVDRLEQNEDWEVLSKKLEDPLRSSYRFDMVFACASSVGCRIMQGVMDRDDLWDAAYDELGQAGLGRWS